MHDSVVLLKLSLVCYSSRSTCPETVWQSSRCLEHRSYILHSSVWISTILWWKWCKFVCPNIKRYCISSQIHLLCFECSTV